MESLDVERALAQCWQWLVVEPKTIGGCNTWALDGRERGGVAIHSGSECTLKSQLGAPHVRFSVSQLIILLTFIFRSYLMYLSLLGETVRRPWFTRLRLSVGLL
jgi:hypothetical protein